MNADELLKAFGVGADATAYGGAVASVISWFLSGKDRDSDLTLRDYQEWAARNRHADVVELLNRDHDAVKILSSVIEQMKDSAVHAVVHHENSTDRRHQELMAELARHRRLDPPRLEIQMTREPYNDPNVSNALFINAFFNVTNPTNRRITIATGVAVLAIDEHRLECYYHFQSPGFLELENHGGAGVFSFHCNRGPDVPLDVSRAQFEYLELKILGVLEPIRFVPSEDPRVLIQVTTV